jgi:hypothetical protein
MASRLILAKIPALAAAIAYWNISGRPAIKPALFAAWRSFARIENRYRLKSSFVGF